jgi:hypothetical protein
MTRHCVPTLLLIVVLTLVGYAQTIDAQITGGKVTFAAPVDPTADARELRIVKLESDVKELKRQMAAILGSEVVIGEVKPLGSVITK